jgi:hypothetical protein
MTAAEYFLDPWVLIQMPFQLALLNQWAVALLAEAMLFQKKISPIFSYGIPKKLTKLAENLRTILDTMKNFAIFLLHLYRSISEDGLEKNFHCALQLQFDEFSSQLTKVMPILEFVTSAEASSVIGAIENIFLAELNAGSDVNPPQVVNYNSAELNTPLYDSWSWIKECRLEKVIIGAMGDRGRCNSELEFVRANTEGVRITNAKYKRAMLRVLKKLVEEKIIRTGRLRGIDHKIIMAAVEKYATHLYVYLLHIFQYKGKNIYRQ